MSKELITILSHLLNKVDHDWLQNKEIVDAMLSLKDKKSFQAPTLLEVSNELKSMKVRNYQQQADKFWNFYESKNWMVGKNKMKSWKASIKTWEFEKDNLIL
tara:strand:+ start:566 stop:871 length:306 start_codon:yes stop_codon:yes gene_type:complete